MKRIAPLDIAKGELEAEVEELECLRRLSDHERGILIAAACRAAAKIEAGRARSGLPPVPPDSWPASTWELLRTHGANAKRS